MSHILTKRIPILFALLLFIAGFFSAELFSKWQAAAAPEHSSAAVSINQNCELTSIRREGYDFTKPLLYVEQSCESADFFPLKNALNELLREQKSSGQISTSSIYVRDFEHGRWMGIGEQSPFHPGSLFKVPLMMIYLKKAESDPNLLEQEFLFEPPGANELPVQTYTENSIKPGKKYTVRELLNYSTVYSDNYAAWLLFSKLNQKEIDGVYQNLGVSQPVKDPEDGEYRTTARDFSIFFRALYNSSFLTPEYSEYALSLLGRSTFDKGFVQGLPANTRVVHKFAEWDNGKEFELHESGIIYVKGKGFLVTIMTRGKNRDDLPVVISSLTKKIYTYISGP